MSKNSRPKGFRQWDFLFQRWNSWLIETNQTALGACIQYALSIEGVERVVVGVETDKAKKMMQKYSWLYKG